VAEIRNNAFASVEVVSGLLDVTGELAVAAAIAIAVLRHRLFDVDLAISRALAYGWLAALVTALYVALVVGTGALLGRPSSPDLLLSLVATIVVALVSLPLCGGGVRWSVYGGSSSAPPRRPASAGYEPPSTCGRCSPGWARGSPPDRPSRPRTNGSTPPGWSTSWAGSSSPRSARSSVTNRRPCRHDPGTAPARRH